MAVWSKALQLTLTTEHVVSRHGQIRKLTVTWYYAVVFAGYYISSTTYNRLVTASYILEKVTKTEIPENFGIRLSAATLQQRVARACKTVVVLNCTLWYCN